MTRFERSGGIQRARGEENLEVDGVRIHAYL